MRVIIDLNSTEAGTVHGVVIADAKIPASRTGSPGGWSCSASLRHSLHPRLKLRVDAVVVDRYENEPSARTNPASET